MTPIIHAEMSVKYFGGVVDDYMDIHKLMDSSKSVISDNRHRALTHNIWFVNSIIPLIFGEQRINSENKKYSPKDIAEFHVYEDFDMKYIPTAQDFLENMEFIDWMHNGKKGLPNSVKLLKTKQKIAN